MFKLVALTLALVALVHSETVTKLKCHSVTLTKAEKADYDFSAPVAAKTCEVDTDDDAATQMCKSIKAIAGGSETKSCGPCTQAQKDSTTAPCLDCDKALCNSSMSQTASLVAVLLP